MTPTEAAQIRRDYLAAHHSCPECDRKHAPNEIAQRYRRRSTTCVECGRFCGDNYYLAREVWKATGLERFDGVLHLACVEKRIGRRLTLEDFTDAPLNDQVRWVAEHLAQGSNP